MIRRCGPAPYRVLFLHGGPVRPVPWAEKYACEPFFRALRALLLN